MYASAVSFGRRKTPTLLRPWRVPQARQDVVRGDAALCVWCPVMLNGSLRVPTPRVTCRHHACSVSTRHLVELLLDLPRQIPRMTPRP